MELLHKDLTNKIIKAFYEVYHTLGYGFLEKVYENALYNELISMDLQCDKQLPINECSLKSVVFVFFKANSIFEPELTYC
jgi:GxxExxY protein